MKRKSCSKPKNPSPVTPVNFDLFRLSKSKAVVDISPNTIRKYEREKGLRLYRHGKATFVSKVELENVIRRG